MEWSTGGEQMRMIDADLPMEQMEKLLDHHLMMGNFSADGAVSDCINFLKTAPTIDAVPVRHGHWVKNEKRPGFFECSCCHCHDRETYPFYTNVWKYCPNCGAKMDGERRDDG